MDHATSSVTPATSAQPDAQASSEWRRMVAVSIAVFAIGLAARYFLLRSPLGFLNADEAVTGLTAYDVLNGRPSLLFGASNYGATIEGWLAAPLGCSVAPNGGKGEVVWITA